MANTRAFGMVLVSVVLTLTSVDPPAVLIASGRFK